MDNFPDNGRDYLEGIAMAFVAICVIVVAAMILYLAGCPA